MVWNNVGKFPPGGGIVNFNHPSYKLWKEWVPESIIWWSRQVDSFLINLRQFIMIKPRQVDQILSFHNSSSREFIDLRPKVLYMIFGHFWGFHCHSQSSTRKFVFFWYLFRLESELWCCYSLSEWRLFACWLSSSARLIYIDLWFLQMYFLLNQDNWREIRGIEMPQPLHLL